MAQHFEGKRALMRRFKQMQESGQTLFVDNMQKGQAFVWLSEQLKFLLERFPAIKDDAASQELIGFANDIQAQLANAAAKREQLQKENKDGATQDRRTAPVPIAGDAAPQDDGKRQANGDSLRSPSGMPHPGHRQGPGKN